MRLGCDWARPLAWRHGRFTAAWIAGMRSDVRRGEGGDVRMLLGGAEGTRVLHLIGWTPGLERLCLCITSCLVSQHTVPMRCIETCICNAFSSLI